MRRDLRVNVAAHARTSILAETRHSDACRGAGHTDCRGFYAAGAELKPQQAIPPELALKAAVAASQSALDAMTRARDALSADIIDQQQRHQQLQLLLAAASR